MPPKFQNQNVRIKLAGKIAREGNKERQESRPDPVDTIIDVGNNGEDAFEAINASSGETNSSTGISMTVDRDFTPSSVPNMFVSADPSVGNYGVISPMRIRINTNGPFVRIFGIGNAKLPKIGDYPAGFLRSRVVQILHEIGHLIFVDKFRFPSGSKQNGVMQMNYRVALLFPTDGGNSELSMKNTTTVTNACRKQIDSAK
jgi:hypothetical protein